MDSKGRTERLMRRSQHVPRQRAILERDGDYVILTDLDTAGYLHGVYDLGISHGIKEGPSQHRIYVYDPEHIAEEKAIEFINDRCSKFADGIRRIKKILHNFGGKPKKKRERTNGRNGERR